LQLTATATRTGWREYN